MMRPFVLGIIIFALSVSGVRAQSVDKIVAIVNADVVTEQDLAVFMKVADVDYESLPDQDPAAIRRLFLDRLVEDQLILQAAKSQQVRVDESAIEARIEDMRLRVGGAAAFDQALRQQGITLSELRKKLSEQYLVYMVIQREVRSKIQVAPREVTEYYEEHADDFLVPESAVVDSIFVKEQAEAQAVRSALASGEAFEEVFKKYSKRANLGAVRRGQLKKALEDFVFSLAPGAPSEPYPFDDGYYIFVLRTIEPPARQTIDEVKEAITQKLENEKFERAYKTWIEGLKDKAYISIRET
ncbi:MAG: peptidyl-prolyl cis-trans isomerase [Deltaproteobacteria bacterium]